MRMSSRRRRLASAALALVSLFLLPAPHERKVEARAIPSSRQHAIAPQVVNVTGTVTAINNAHLDHRGSDGLGDVYDYNVSGHITFTNTGGTGSVAYHQTITKTYTCSGVMQTGTLTTTGTEPLTYHDSLLIQTSDAVTNPAGATLRSDATHIVYTRSGIFPDAVNHANQTDVNPSCGVPVGGRNDFGVASAIGQSTFVLGSVAPGSTGLKGQMKTPLSRCPANIKCSGGEEMSWDLHRINALDIHQVHLMNRDAHPGGSNAKEYTPLTFLSASPHPYCGTAGSNYCLGASGGTAGFTKVFGTVAVSGEAQQYLASLILRVKEKGNTIAESSFGTLFPQIVGSRFGGRILGTFGTLKIAHPTLLFDLASHHFANVMQNHDGNLELEIEATSDWGDKATKSLGTVKKLVWAEGLPRYQERDPDYGGDGWVLPSVLDVVRYYTNHHPAAMHGIAWGDFSRMNGGHFRPHGSHRIGNDVDGFFSGYWQCEHGDILTNDQYCNYGIPVPTFEAVALLVQWLDENVTYERRIQYCFVDYQIPLLPGKGRAINQTRYAIYHLLETTHLKDGRIAFNVIRQDPEHFTHFHLRIIPQG